MICVFGPSVLFLFVILLMYLIPLLSPEHIDTDIQIVENSYGIPMFHNESNTITRPINRYYSQISKRLQGRQIGISKTKFHSKEFFKNFDVQFLEKDGKTVLQNPAKIFMAIYTEWEPEFIQLQQITSNRTILFDQNLIDILNA